MREPKMSTLSPPHNMADQNANADQNAGAAAAAAAAFVPRIPMGSMDFTSEERWAREDTNMPRWLTPRPLDARIRSELVPVAADLHPVFDGQRREAPRSYFDHIV
jgi:hypothetical protein